MQANTILIMMSVIRRFDDIEDDSQLRRGIPVTHKVYGIAQTVNTASYVCFSAYRELAKLREHSEEAPPTENAGNAIRLIPQRNLDMVVTDELVELHRGQGLDILWRDTLTCPTEAEYLDMVSGST